MTKKEIIISNGRTYEVVPIEDIIRLNKEIKESLKLKPKKDMGHLNYKEEAERLISRHKVFLNYDCLQKKEWLDPSKKDDSIEKDAIRLSIICVDEIINSVQKNLPDAKSVINYYKMVQRDLRFRLKSYFYYNHEKSIQIIA